MTGTPRISIVEARCALAEVRDHAARGDFEVAHRAEDDLHARVLATISHRPPGTQLDDADLTRFQELARIALRTSKIEFRRGYAP